MIGQDHSPGSLDLRDPRSVIDTLRRGAEANRDASCRQGSIDVIRGPGRLIATGDLHDNPLHLARLAELAELPLNLAGVPDSEEAPGEGLCHSGIGCHLTLHELIHSDRLVDGMDFSYRVLTRIAALKTFAPERVHVLLANHELSQIIGAGVIKNGVRCTEAFNQAIDYTFDEDAVVVHEAVADFIRSMPLAMRVESDRGDVLCAHSLPAPGMMQRFDPGILSRELTEDDYIPREGSAHLMVWGRGYDAEQIEDLVERWGVSLFVLGHEHAPSGINVVEPCAVVLNSDHERGVYLPIDLDDPPSIHEASLAVRPLRG
ncbi:MAG: metallophosphoesterase [Planctomycetota bacterium]